MAEWAPNGGKDLAFLVLGPVFVGSGASGIKFTYDPGWALSILGQHFALWASLGTRRKYTAGMRIAFSKSCNTPYHTVDPAEIALRIVPAE